MTNIAMERSTMLLRTVNYKWAIEKPMFNVITRGYIGTWTMAANDTSYGFVFGHELPGNQHSVHPLEAKEN